MCRGFCGLRGAMPLPGDWRRGFRGPILWRPRIRRFSNLISNAYRYGKNNGNIYVTLTEKENETELSVKDDGIGIAEKDIKKIFDRFYQADNSRSNTGTGLGLSMVKEIAKMHDGEVSVESEPGKGSTFTLHLPHRKSRE